MSAKNRPTTAGSVSLALETPPIEQDQETPPAIETAISEDLPEPPPPCSRCGEPREGKATWCKDCRAKYQREYVAQAAQMAANRGFEIGVKTFRAMMALEFARRGKIHFTGAEVCFAIENAPRPGWPIEPKP